MQENVDESTVKDLQWYTAITFIKITFINLSHLITKYTVEFKLQLTV